MHFVLQNALAALAALAIARLAASGREPWRRALAALVAYGVVVYGSMLALGLTVGLSNLSVEALLVAVASPLALLAWREGPSPAHPEARDQGGPGATTTAAAVLGAFVAVWIAGSTLLGTRFGIDDFTYHASVPAHWVTQGRIELAPFTYQSYYPMNAEVLTLWFLLPFRSDAWAGLGDLYGWLLVAVSAYGLARSVGGTTASALWAATLASVSRDMLSRMGVFAQPDVVGTGMTLAALAFLAPSADGTAARESRMPRWNDAALAGFAMGFALGCKVSYATVLAALVVWWLLDESAGLRRAGAARLLAVFAAATAATGSYWYLRNAWLTGNPFYPAALGPFPGPLDAAAQGRTKLWTWLVSSPGGPGAWSEGLARLASWPATLAILSLAGIAWTAVRLLRRRAAPHAGFAALLVAVALVQIAQFPFLPFSATFNRPYAGLEGIATRYLILPFAVGVVLLARVEGPRLSRFRIVEIAALLCVATCLPPLAGLFGGAALPAAVVLAGALAGLATARSAGLRRRLASSGTAFALLLAAFSAAALTLPLRQRATDGNLFAVAREGLAIGEGWKALETLPPGSRVAFFMADPFDYTHFHPIFGRAFLLVPVPLERDGAPRVPLHRRPPARWWSDWDDLERPVEPGTFRENLSRSKIDFVAVTRWTLGRWPSQREALRAWGTEGPVYGDGCTEIWRIKNGSAP